MCVSGFNMGRLENKQFLETLQTELSQNDGKKSVYLTQKRMVDLAEGSTMEDLPSNVVDTTGFATNTATYPVLIRASLNGKKTKISTVVQTDELDAFWTEYVQILKNGLVGLRKKDKRKKKKGGK